MTEDKKHVQSRRLLIMVGLVSVLLILVITVGTPRYSRAREKHREAETKTNVHTIQIALECYWVDHCVYPPDIETLFADGYMSSLPKNAFSGQPMKEIAFGAYPYQGEFTYMPYTVDSNVRGYYLMAYGKNGAEGQDLDEDGVDDHVIMVAENGCGCGCRGTPKLDEIYPPPFKDFLKAQKENPQAPIDVDQLSAGGE